MTPLRFLVSASLLVGCRDHGEDDLAPCGFAEPPTASFDVLQERTDSGWTLHVSGWVGDGPWPVFHEQVLDDGSCRKLEYEPGLCEPDCDHGEICVSGSCVAWPEGISAGTATVRTPEATLTIGHDDAWAGWYWGSLELDEDAWGEGQELSLELAGATFPATELWARGVLPVESDLEEQGLWVDDQAATLRWKASEDEGACMYATLYTFSGGHGLPIKDVVECAAPDTGSLTIPATIMELFPGWNTPGACAGSDCPYSELVRATRFIAPGSVGDVWLTVYDVLKFSLEAEENEVGWWAAGL